MNAIETRYKGYRFRSRTEARWAVYFDACMIPWEYEREGYRLSNGQWYLPDFWLTLSSGFGNGGREPKTYNHMWAEVKGQPFTQEEILKCTLLSETTGVDCLMLDGIPDFKAYAGTNDISGPVEYERTYVVGIDHHDYPHTEGRFYCNPGEPITSEYFPDLEYAIAEARSARF